MIEIVNLHHRYPDGTYALKGITLNIARGEFLLICGPNGSGKTTLARMIPGLLEPSVGMVRINGLNAVQHSREARQAVGMVFQEADSQIVGETVNEDVSFGPENMGLSASEVTERTVRSLRAMGLESLSEKPAYLLSGGEKRRLSIASVLAMKPQAVVLDEPFSHLDYSGVREVLRIMIDLHREGHTLVVTTHDVEKVITHVDRVAILHGGELKAVGSTEAMIGELSRFDIRPPCYVLLGKERISWLSG